MTSTNELVIEDVSDEVAAEIGYGILGRAMDIHENPDDDHEDIAVELRDIGREIISEYEEVAYGDVRPK